MNLKKTIAILFTVGALSASAYLFLEKDNDQSVNQEALPKSVLEIKKEEKGEVAPVVFEEKNDINKIDSPVANDNKFVERGDVESIVANYIEENPIAILKSIEKYYNKKSSEQKEKKLEILSKNKKELFEQALDPKIGDIDSKIKIVLFFNYDCVYCQKATEVIEKLTQEYNFQAIFKEYAVTAGEISIANKIGIAINMIDRSQYQLFHKYMFDPNKTDKSEDGVLKLASELGINSGKINDILQKEDTKKKFDDLIKCNEDLISMLGISATPAYIIHDTKSEDNLNDIIHIGFLDYDALKGILEKMAADKKANTANNNN